MHRIARRALAVACVLTAALVVVVPSTSSAAGPDAVGWWSRQLPFQGEAATSSGVRPQGAGDAVRFGPRQVPPVGAPVTTAPLPINPPTIPAPPVTTPGGGAGSPNPGVPEGGLWVGNDPSGPNAVSTLRFRGDVGAGELTLVLAPGSTTAGRIVACPTLSGWTPGPSGAWRDRPAHDCDRLALTGNYSPDATSVSFTIPQGFTPFGERTVDIMVLPAPGSGDAFSLYFQAPGSDSLEVFAPQVPGTETETETTPPETETAPLPAPFAPAPPATAFTSPPFDASPQPVDEVATAEPTSSLPFATPRADVFAPVAESRATRMLSVVLLLLLGLGLWFLGDRPARAPRLIGGLAIAGPQVTLPVHSLDLGGGIGRFRRERAAPPTRL